MGSDLSIPPVPSVAAIIGIGQDEYEILSHIVEKSLHGALKEKNKTTAEKTEAKADKKEEKDLNFFSLLGAFVMRNLKNLPATLAKHWIPLAVMAGLWIFLQWLVPLFIYGWPAPFQSLYNVFVFLTASMNNFFGKVLFAGAITGFVLPAYHTYKQSGVKDLISKYRKVAGMIGKAFIALGQSAWKVVLSSAGLGLVVANVISTNNSFNKYFVCLLSGLALVNSLAFGAGEIKMKLFQAAYRDIAKGFGSRKVPSVQASHAVFSSFSAGLAGSIVPSLLVSPITGFQAISGYVIGGVAVVAAVVLHFVLKEKTAKGVGDGTSAA